MKCLVIIKISPVARIPAKVGSVQPDSGGKKKAMRVKVTTTRRGGARIVSERQLVSPHQEKKE